MNPFDNNVIRWIGPYHDALGWGTSPYLDWYLENYYIHYRGWVG